MANLTRFRGECAHRNKAARCVIFATLQVEADGVPWMFNGYGQDEAPHEGRQPAADVVLGHCLAHRRAVSTKPLRVRQVATACDAACERATSKDCRCSCGGLRHGASA